MAEHFEKIIPTYQYGLSFSKPSVKCFKKILNYEKIKPYKMVYIGDNPYKDFINIKKLGIKTIRIKRGAYRNIVLDKNYEADYTVKNLDKISKKMIGWMKIGNYEINDNSPAFIIAELSANHNGSLETAKQTIKQQKKLELIV